MPETGINFLELVKEFEAKLQTDYEFQLLEMYYMPYSFGTGMIAYRIKGKVVKIMYNGKDFLATLFVSAKYVKYLYADLTEVFSGSSADLLSFGISGLKINYLN